VTLPPNFRFRDTATSRTGISAGEGASEFMHPLLPVTHLPANGWLVTLNGWNLNRIQADITGYDGTTATAVQMLQMRAPRESILPMVSMPGMGRMFRPGAKWRYRWGDSRTGRFTGLSPLPDVAINMGVETIDGGSNYLGQTAYFYIPTSGKPAPADTIQLFANTTLEEETWYLADEAATGSSSYILPEDNSTAAALFTNLAVVTDTSTSITAGPTWSEGVMDPRVKAWQHPSGRVYYFGLLRWGQRTLGSGTLTITTGDDLCTLGAVAGRPRLLEPGRIGQRIRFFYSATDVAISDPTVYRILATVTADTFRITPEYKDVGGTLKYQIEDDRDARWTFMSEPNIPWLIDPLKILSQGDDFDDGVLDWFTLGGRIFVQTRKRIYEAINGFTDDPSRSTQFIVTLEEGACGLYAGCITPFGYVYVHPTRGVRLFGGTMAVPFGNGDSPFNEFLPATQFARFEPSALESVRCVYDDENRNVIVSYVPTGGSSLSESIVFSTSEKNWRGPYRERLFSVGKMQSTSSAPVMVTGDDFGNVTVRDNQALDMVQANSVNGDQIGTVTSVATVRVFSDSGQTFDLENDERLRGCPIWFVNPATGLRYFARIADVLSDTQLELTSPPVDESGVTATLAVGWTYGVGTLRWQAITAYLDAGGDPAHIVEFFKLDVRFKLGTATDTFEVGAATDANGTYEGVRDTAATAGTQPTRDVLGNVHGEMLLKNAGALIQLRVRGVSRTGQAEITRAILISEERDGSVAT